VDFGDLGVVVFVFGSLRWAGDLRLTGLRPSPRRSWLFMMPGALDNAGNGTIQFEVCIGLGCSAAAAACCW
jgi:hypothetical protein